jgi:hypothetical protein
MKRTYLIFILILTACRKTPPKSYEIISVELARSGAWSDFGATIRVDSSMNYIYFGDKGQIKQGYFAGKISRELWDTLNQRLEKTRFKSVDTTTNLNTKDGEYYQLIVHWTTGKRNILRVGDTSADTILAFCKWMDTTYKLVKLHRLSVNISNRFETKFHNTYRPTIAQVKFPPPEKYK